MKILHKASIILILFKISICPLIAQKRKSHESLEPIHDRFIPTDVRIVLPIAKQPFALCDSIKKSWLLLVKKKNKTISSLAFPKNSLGYYSTLFFKINDTGKVSMLKGNKNDKLNNLLYKLSYKYISNYYWSPAYLKDGDNSHYISVNSTITYHITKDYRIELSICDINNAKEFYACK